MVGAMRFELTTPGPPDRCANRAALRSVLRHSDCYCRGRQGLLAAPGRRGALLLRNRFQKSGVDPVLHDVACLEHNDPPRCDWHNLACLRISPDTLRFLPEAKR